MTIICTGPWNVWTLLKPSKIQEFDRTNSKYPIRKRCNTSNKMAWKNNVTLLSVYVPTENKINADKDYFYGDSQTVANKVPERYVVIIFGDVNAKLGKELIYSNVT
jgi:hypothetical protein